MEENVEKKNNLFIKILAIVIILIIGLFLYARYIGNSGLVVNEYPIVDNELPSSFNGFKIVQFADIHYGVTTSLKDIKKIVVKINELKPDLVVFTGDLFDESIKVSDSDVNSLKEELSKIDSKINKYATKGDSDNKNLVEFETIFKYAGFTILDNMNELLYYKNTIPIKIVGTTSLLKSDINYEQAFSIFGDENDYYTILLTHEPLIVDKVSSYNVNTILSAHSLGGLINIPFIGGIIKYNGSNNYLDGYYKLDKTNMYVNSGIGTKDYKFRLNNRPSINLYRLYNY